MTPPLTIPGVTAQERRHSRVLQSPLAAPRAGVMLHYDDSSRDDWAVAWFDDPACTNGYTWLVLDNGAVVELADPAMRTPTPARASPRWRIPGSLGSRRRPTGWCWQRHRKSRRSWRVRSPCSDSSSGVARMSGAASLATMNRRSGHPKTHAPPGCPTSVRARGGTGSAARWIPRAFGRTVGRSSTSRTSERKSRRDSG